MDNAKVIELLPILFERFSAFQNLWNLDIVVTLGLLGFFVQAERLNRSRVFTGILLLGYVVFAYSNFDALQSVLKQRQVVENAIVAELPKVSYLPDLTKSCVKPITPAKVLGSATPVSVGASGSDGCPISPPNEYTLSLFHLGFDILTIAAIVWIHLCRYINPAKPGPAA